LSNTPKEDSPVRYLLLIAENPSARPTTPAAGEKLMADYTAFTESITVSKELVAADRLRPIEAATSVRVRDGKTLATDGPFAETAEHLGGYYLVDVSDLDRAIELAAQIPASRDGVIEVRPIWEQGEE
jgi:hypothetical protein